MYSTSGSSLYHRVEGNLVSDSRIPSLSFYRKAHSRHLCHHKHDGKKQQEYERFSSHGCKFTNNLSNTARIDTI